ncbi:MAG: Fic family protein [Arenicella sp.]|jgi:Fic family protein
MRRIKIYIHKQDDWPQFTWQDSELQKLLGEVRNLQGKTVGKMENLGFDLRDEASLETLTMDVVKSSEIEGEMLDKQEVRSSIAQRLGLEISGLVELTRDVDGVVDMMLDATQKASELLTEDRLFGWHNCLFPTGRSGMYKILVSQWRDDSTGPMQVVSGAMSKEKVHFEAPKASRVQKEMEEFIRWFDEQEAIDPVLKAGIAHLWFLTIHPFEDGNGRIARALTDMLLARADGISQRFYSMSTQIRIERKGYYSILEKTQKGNLDITEWLRWFLECLKQALLASGQIVEKVLFKHRFWDTFAQEPFNERQIKMLNKLIDGFTGKLSSSKWAKITKCSPDTALRDIQGLIEKGILRKTEEGGRNTNYELVEVAS